MTNRFKKYLREKKIQKLISKIINDSNATSGKYKINIKELGSFPIPENINELLPKIKFVFE